MVELNYLKNEKRRIKMQKITKKYFKKLLIDNPTKFISSVWGWNDDRVEAAIGNLNPERVKKMSYRTVNKIQTNSIMFSNGSWLHFDDEGQHNYFEYVVNEIRYLIMRTTIVQDNKQNYMIYAL